MGKRPLPPLSVLQTFCAIAETGVDRISIGSLTKDVQATDFSLRVVG